MRLGAEKHREIVMKLGVDVSELEKSPELSRRYIQELIGGAERAGQKLEDTNRKVLTTDQRLKTAFGGRPRFTALSYLGSQLSGLSYNLAGVSGASRAVTGGFSLMQSGAMALSAPMTAVLGTSAALVTILGAVKLAAHKSSESFERYIKSIRETEKEQRRLRAELDAFEEGASRYNAVIYGLIGTVLGWEKAADYAAKSTGKWTESMVDFRAEQDRQVEFWKIQNRLLEGENIPNLQNLVNWYEEEISRIKTLAPEQIGEIDRLKELNRLIKERMEAEEKLTEAIEYQKRYPPIPVPELREIPPIELPFKPLEPVDVKFFEKIPEDWEIMADQMVARLKAFRMEVMGYVHQISGAFAAAMVGIKMDWGSMIQSLVAQLIQSQITSWIAKLLFPTPLSGMQFLYPGFPLQHGTPYVPQSGYYHLERGERVIPAEQNIQNIRNYGDGSVTNYYLLTLDVGDLTRKEIIPRIERLAQTRRTKILTG